MQATTSKFMRGGNLYEQCHICNCQIPRNVIRNHNLSLQHIDKANALYADSPVVEIKGMGPAISLEDCHKFLLSFGNIENIVLRIPRNPNVVRVTFQKSEDTKCLKNNKDPIYYKGNKLLAWAVYSEGNKSKASPDTPAISNNKKSVQNRKKDKNKNKFLAMAVKEAVDLNLKGNFVCQLTTLMTEVRLKVSGVFMMREVCEDIEYVLKRFFPGCQVSPFGSVITGLAFEGSDFDCYCNTNKAKPWTITSKSDDFKTLHKARKAFYTHSSIFQNITFIPHAKVPLIRLKHIRTNVNVDINFKSPFGVANGELMRYLLSCDDRILHLAIFIKYWAKSLSFVGTNRFTSYNMLLLVVFYLQKMEQPILPSISSLQQNPQHDSHLGDWNVGFSKGNVPTNHNDQNVLSLVDGFFEFYSNFKFNNVICPFLGNFLPAEQFESLDLPREYHSFVQKVNNGEVKNLSPITSITIQDPIELNKNCSAAVNDSMMCDFIQECKASSYIVKKALKNNDQSNLIVKLTTLCKFIPETVSAQTHSFLLPFKMRNVKNELVNAASINRICGDVRRLVEKMLSEVVKCKFTTFFDKRPNNSAYPTITFDCETFYNLWSNRHQITDGLPTLFEEVRISTDIFNNLSAKENSQQLFKFLLNICVKGKLCEVNIVSKYCKENHVFYDFLEVMLPIFERQLRQYVIQ